MLIIEKKQIIKGFAFSCLIWRMEGLYGYELLVGKWMKIRRKFIADSCLWARKHNLWSFERQWGLFHPGMSFSKAQ